MFIKQFTSCLNENPLLNRESKTLCGPSISRACNQKPNPLFRAYLLSNTFRAIVMSAERGNNAKKPKQSNSFSNHKASTKRADKTQSSSRPYKPLSLTQEITKLNRFIFNKNFICCKESRIESANSFYSSFYLGPFEESFSQTLAHNLRRTLLSELTGLAITAVEIDGVLHRFSSVPGTKETTMDILSNLQNVVLKKTKTFDGGSLSQTEVSMGSRPLSHKSTYGEFSTNNFSRILTNQIAYLRTRGPGVVKAADIILPSGIECVNPDQHLATLAEDGILNMKLIINEGKNAIKQKSGYGPQTNSNYNWGLGSSPFIEGSEDLTFTPMSNNGASAFAPASLGQLGHFETNFGSGAPLDINNQDFPSFDDSSTLNSIDFSNFENYMGSNSGQEEGGNNSPLVAKSNSLNSNLIFLDSVFMPVTKVNAFVEANAKATDIVLESSPEFINPSSKTIQDILENFYSQAGKEHLSEPGTTGQDSFYGRSAPLTNNIESSGEVDSTEPSKASPKMFFKVMPDQMQQETYGAEGHICENFLILDSNGAPAELGQLGIKIDYKPETQILLNQPKNQCHIVLEIWTNGSIHPRQALKAALDLLTRTFFTLNNVKQLGSMYKSDLTYKKILKKL